MKVVSITDFRANQRKYLDIADSGEDLIIHRKDGKAYLILPVSKNDRLAVSNHVIKNILDSERMILQGKIIPVKTLSAKYKVHMTGAASYDKVMMYEKDPQLFAKIMRMIDEMSENPYEGSGDPTRLKYKLAGYWARTLDHNHTMVYRVEDDEVIIMSLKQEKNEERDK